MAKTNNFEYLKEHSDGLVSNVLHITTYSSIEEGLSHLNSYIEFAELGDKLYAYRCGETVVILNDEGERKKYLKMHGFC